jgi:Holliday junction resolvase RusA-like endonuclease
MISFNVYGIPAPQGSKTAKVINGRVIMWEASSKVKPWRAAVKNTATSYMRDENVPIISKPVEICLTFFMPKPKSVKREVPSVKPDLDKLIRSTLDGLSKVCYVDDALVIAIGASKIYTKDTPGCLITIVEQDEDA